MWRTSSNSQALAGFVKRQTRLEQLWLGYNYFNAEATEVVLTAIAQSASMHTIQKLYMQQSDFSADGACRQLAKIIASAPKLGECYIDCQEGARKISVTVAPNWGGQNHVTVKDKASGATICSVQTNRRKCDISISHY